MPSGEGVGRIVRVSDGAVVASRAVRAEGFLRRLRGWMGRCAIGDGEALVIPRCRAVHTCFLFTPIDVVFASAGLSVTDVVPALRPWSFANTLRGDQVIELAAGASAKAGLLEGDVLRWEEAP